jgi:di/tricarboxylate transporter
MYWDQIVIVLIFAGSLGLFIWGKWRYDIIATLTLLVAIFVGAVPYARAFEGFSHPAVITVACILILSQAIKTSHFSDIFVGVSKHLEGYPLLQFGSLIIIVAVCSAFMNNIGALTLIMPLALHIFAKSGRSPSILLMPLAFASILGGLTTMIGTPPNIIIANYRDEVIGEPFAMFDYAAVGGLVALGGILFLIFIGWRLLPQRRKPGVSASQAFHIRDYITQMRITADSPLMNKTVEDVEHIGKGDLSVVGIQRGTQKILAPSSKEKLRSGDLLVVEGTATSLNKLIERGDLQVLGGDIEEMELDSAEIALIEAVVVPGGSIERMTPNSARLHKRFGINVLGIARQGRTITAHLGRTTFAAGDVLLLQGNKDDINDSLPVLGCLPLAERELDHLKDSNTYVRIGIFIAALFVSAMGWLPPQIAFLTAVLGVIFFGEVRLRDIYTSIDWPIIVLIACYLPIGEALYRSGATTLLGEAITSHTSGIPNIVVLAVVMWVSMLLSEVLNNSATAVIMAPLSIEIARSLGVATDPFLMAVAIGCSCSFMTPLAHPSHMLVMGPGSYKFTDYWRLGLPLEIVVLAIAVPSIYYIWPL